MRRPVLAVLLFALLLAGTASCGDDAEVRTGDQPPGSTDGHGAGDPQLAISIEVGGGFAPYGSDFLSPPTVVLDDGTVFTGGATIAIYPGPAISPVLTGSIDGDELRALLDEAGAAGLTADGELDTGQPGITDMASTTITVRVDGTTFEHSIYALSGAPDMGPELGLTRPQLELREQLATFVQHVTDAAAGSATDPYPPTAYEVLASPASGEDPQVEPNHLDWPLAAPIEAGACQRVEGDDAAALAPILAKATEITVWTDPGTGDRYQLRFRAVLPGVERDC
jgi:hypothetical protein